MGKQRENNTAGRLSLKKFIKCNRNLFGEEHFYLINIGLLQKQNVWKIFHHLYHVYSG